MVIALRLLKIPLFIGFLKKLRKNDKIYSDDNVLEEQLIKYIVLNKKKVEHIMIKNFKNKLTTLKEILKDKNKIEEIRGLYFKKEEKIKKELIELETRKDGELEKLEEALRYGRVKNTFWKRFNTIYDEKELREKTQKRIDEIEKLRRTREIESKDLSIEDDEFISLLIKLNTDKKYVQEELVLIEIKSKKLKISEKTINAIR